MKTLVYRLAADLVGMPLTSEQLEELAGAPVREGCPTLTGVDHCTDGVSASKGAHQTSKGTRSMLKRIVATGSLQNRLLDATQSLVSMSPQGARVSGSLLSFPELSSSLTTRSDQQMDLEMTNASARIHKSAVPMVEIGGFGREQNGMRLVTARIPDIRSDSTHDVHRRQSPSHLPDKVHAQGETLFSDEEESCNGENRPRSAWHYLSCCWRSN